MNKASKQFVEQFDVHALRGQFPILHQQVNGKPLVYLDNAATSQKPTMVIEAIANYYKEDNSNVHRGAHTLSDRATQCFEDARITVQQFINAKKREEIIWTRGTTEAINLVACSYARNYLSSGDKIVVTTLEHHSNIVPWQMAAAACGATVVPVVVTEAGEIDLDALDKILDEHVKIVAVAHVSNALGTVNPIETIIDKAHAVGAKVLIDGAQGVSHYPIDVQKLDCDFYAFSGHKMFGPTGIGVLFAKEELLEIMPPYQGGGEMIETVSFEGTTYNQLPYKFEAGTPNIAGAVGIAAAVDFLNLQDRAAMQQHEEALLSYVHKKAASFDDLRRVGTAKDIAGVFSFLLDGTHPADVGMILDQLGIAVRTGDHCAQPVMSLFNIPGTVRASFSIYNTFEEIDVLFAGLEKAKEFLL